MLPQIGCATSNQRPCCAGITRWDNSTKSGPVNYFYPQTNGATCCPTCLWSSHAGLSVNTKINPLTPCSVQIQSGVHLGNRIREKRDHRVPSNNFSTTWMFDQNTGFWKKILHSLCVIFVELENWCGMILVFPSGKPNYLCTRLGISFMYMTQNIWLILPFQTPELYGLPALFLPSDSNHLDHQSFCRR